jgi:RecA/RadA recombinase
MGRRNVMEYVERVVRKGSHALVVVSGLQALPTGDELLMRTVSQGLRRLCSATHATRTCVLFLRDDHDNTGLLGTPDSGAVGNSLRYYATMRVHAQATPWHDGGRAGIVGQLHVVKNKLNPPFARCGFMVQHSHGLVAEEMIGAEAAAQSVDAAPPPGEASPAGELSRPSTVRP